jgi:hypothetical protein
MMIDFSRRCEMQSREDLLKRAAECEQLMDGKVDDLRRAAFRLLRDMWIALANESAAMAPEELAQDLAAIAQIQLGLQMASEDGPRAQVQSTSRKRDKRVGMPRHGMCLAVMGDRSECV